MGGGCEGIIWDPSPPSCLSQPPSTVAFLYAAPGAGGQMSCAVPVASLVQPGGHRPSLSRFSSRCAALHEGGAAPSEVKGRAARRKDGTLLYRENKKTEKRRKRTSPAFLAGRQGLGCLRALQGRHAGVVPPAQNMQALVAAAAHTRSQLSRNLLVPHACHLTRRDAARDRCLESDIHGRSRNMQLVSISHGKVYMTCDFVVSL